MCQKVTRREGQKPRKMERQGNTVRVLRAPGERKTDTVIKEAGTQRPRNRVKEERRKLCSIVW